MGYIHTYNIMKIQNAKIKSTILGYEGHGIFTCHLNLEYDGGGQAFGGYGMGGYDKKSGKQSGYGSEFIKRVLKVVGVEKWEDLPGKHIRVEAEHTKVHRIGNILKDEWFDPKELAEELGLK